MRYAFLLVALLTLAGCQTDGIGAGDISNVCDALGANANPNQPGGIKYNTQNNKHGRFAGKVLALDLATRNRIGIGLHCKGF